jgi:hypothetical protein
MGVVTLSLPSLPADLITRIRLFSNTLAIDNSNREWLNKFHNNTVSVVNHEYVACEEIAEDVNKLYGAFFNERIIPIVGIQRNVTNILSCTPPHYDSVRVTAINFVIDPGGDNVRTCFYDATRTDQNLDKAQNFFYNQNKLVESCLLEQGKWYLFNPQQCHSVENIETTRIFLGLLLSESKLDFDSFKIRFKHLIESTHEDINLRQHSLRAK